MLKRRQTPVTQWSSSVIYGLVDAPSGSFKQWRKLLLERQFIWYHESSDQEVGTEGWGETHKWSRALV